MKPASKTFELPMMSVIRYSQDDEGFVAHALDFDLVAVGETEDEATEKIRWAIKAYIEYGLKNYWQNHILCRAPKEMTNISMDTSLKLMEPIIVQDTKLCLARTSATNEAKPVTRVS